MSARVVDHPLVRTKISVLRDHGTGIEVFRRTVRELSLLVGYEALRDVEVEASEVETPLAKCPAWQLSRGIVLMPILRAGLGMAEAMAELLPGSAMGHIGMFRDEQTLEPQSYFLRVPPDIGMAHVLVVDPMLATGNSGAAAIDQIKEAGATRITLACLVGCPQGISQIESRHPDVPIVLAAIDDKLNEKGYIVPGLGDAGDRYYGT